MERTPPDGGGGSAEARTTEGSACEEDGERTYGNLTITTHLTENGGGPHHIDGGTQKREDPRDNEDVDRCPCPSDGVTGASNGVHPEESTGTEQSQELAVGNYAAAVTSNARMARTRGAQPAQEVINIAGKWKPREKHALMTTLSKDWMAGVPQSMSHEVKLTQVAMNASEVRKDDALRTRTQSETEALLAYLKGKIELTHAPNFLKATMTVLQRAMMEEFHEKHVEATLTAVVAPRAKLRKTMTHIALCALLYEANADSERGRAMIARMLDGVKSLQFDGIHTLSFVFHSKRIARWYRGLALRLQGVCITLEDTDSTMQIGILHPAQLRRQYPVRVYGAEELGMVALLAAIAKLPGVEVADAERPRTDPTETIDNRYILISFWGLEFPSGLRGITKVSVNEHHLTMHHHLLYPRMPCNRCYAPYHTTGFCKASYTQQLKAGDGAL